MLFIHFSIYDLALLTFYFLDICFCHCLFVGKEKKMLTPSSIHNIQPSFPGWKREKGATPHLRCFFSLVYVNAKWFMALERKTIPSESAPTLRFISNFTYLLWHRFMSSFLHTHAPSGRPVRIFYWENNSFTIKKQ